MFRTPTCPKCCGNFGAKDLRNPVGPNIPLLLHCGHAFCEGCLRRLAKQDNEKISCSLCKTETHLEKGEESVKHLPLDVYCLGSLLINKRIAIISDEPKPQKQRKKKTKPEEERKQESEDPVPVQNGTSDGVEKAEDESHSSDGIQCEECRKLQATCKCLKCDVTVCEDCFNKIHSASRTLSQHNALPLSNLGTSSITCEEHGNKPLEFFDKDEDQPVCSHCVIGGKHQGHDIVPIHEMCVDVEEGLKNAVTQSKKNLELLKGLEKSLAGHQVASRVHYEELKQEIREHFSFLMALLQIREHNVLKEIEEQCLGQRQAVSKRDDLSNEIKAINGTLKEAESLLQTPSKMIAYGQYVKERLDELSSSCDNLVEVKNEPNQSYTRVRTSGDVVEAIQNHCEVLKDLSSSDSGVSLLNGDHFGHACMLDGQQWRKGSSHLVYVTYIRNPLSFKVQKCADIERLQIMMNKINRYYKHSKAPEDKLDHVSEGDVVCAQFTADNAWYRAEVVSGVSQENDTDISDQKILVRYLDYGNTERLPMQRLRRILPQFTVLPALSKECSLVGIQAPAEGEKWPATTNKILGSLTGDKAMLMVIVEDNDSILQVELRRSENSSGEPSMLSVSDALIFYDVAQYTSGAQTPILCDPEAHKHAEVHGQSQLYTKNNSDEFTNVLVTHCVSPDKFYVQQVGRQSVELAKTMEDMGRVFSKPPLNIWDIPKPHPGMVCGAKFTEDNAWYRAIVTGVNGLKIDVFYVDFGNSETVPWSHIRSLQEKFRILSRQALCCSLAGISSVQSEDGWSDEACSKFSSVALSKNMMMKVRDQSEEQLSVFLYDTSSEDDVFLNKLLVDEGFALFDDEGILKEIENSLAKQTQQPETSQISFKPPEIPSEDFELYVTHVDDKGIIYGQQIKTGDQTVEQLMDVMQVAQFSESTDLKPELSEMKVGQACCAQYSVDKRWYRASVLRHIDDVAVEVYFVDYGNTDQVSASQLRLDMPFIEISQQCVPCQLNQVQLPSASSPGSTDGAVSPQVVRELRRLLISQKCTAAVQGEGTPLPVKLSCLVNVGGKEVITDLGQYLSETMDSVTMV